MKRKTIIKYAFLLTIILLAFSCSSSSKKGLWNLTFDDIKLNLQEHLFGDENNPACNLIMNIAYIQKADETSIKDSINKYIISLCLGEKYISMVEPHTAIDKYATEYVSNYRNDLEPIYRKDVNENEDKATMSAWYSYFKSIEGKIVHYKSNLLTYSCRYEEYTGGAHGIYMTTFFNLDLRTLMPIRLEDIFVDNYQEILIDLLYNQLMIDNQVTTRQELEDLGFTTTGDLFPTENFYFSPEGIVFYYNVYEIAPYVMGPISITLPFEMINHLLNHDCNIFEGL